MNELPSAQFRRRYAKLTEATVVTANGHAIGTWTPIGAEWTHLLPPISDEVKALAPAGTRVERDTRALAKLPAGGVQARQAHRDALLSRINRGK